MSTEPVPIRTIDPLLVGLTVGDLMPIRNGDGHVGDDMHFVAHREWNGDRNETWLTVKCSCGATVGGALTRQRVAAR